MAQPSLNAAFCRTMRQPVEDALAAVAPPGTGVRVGGATYTGVEATFKVTFYSIDEDGTDCSARGRFTAHALSFGLAPDDFGAEFMYKGNCFRIADVRPNARRYPIVATRQDGKRYSFSAGFIKALVRTETRP